MIEKFPNIPETEKQYPAEFIASSNAFILEENDTSVTVGITEKTPADIEESLKVFHRKKIIFVNVPQIEFTSWFNQELGKSNPQKKSINSTSFSSLETFDKDAPAVNLVNSICTEGIRQGASDIHIEAEKKIVNVRYRINGELKKIMEIEKSRFDSISSRIKIMAGLNIMEKRLPQDGRITLSVSEENIDLRVSTVPVTDGESIVMRILGKKAELSSISELGFSEETENKIRKMLAIPHGLILVTGPTGSGKTTTLNAMMKELACEERKIISIEDPVEFTVEGVNQIQVNTQTGLNFSSILRRVLRQDPDIIMVGEIRDKETAELSLRAALTGHLVLTTLHTNDALSGIDRLINLGLEPYLIADVLKGTLAQRLIKSNSEKKRQIVSECFVTDSKLAEMISKNYSKSELKNYLTIKGMTFLKDDAIRKISSGLIKKEDAIREVEI